MTDRPFTLKPGQATAATLLLLVVQATTGGALIAALMLFDDVEAWPVDPTWFLAIIIALSLYNAVTLALHFGRSSWRDRALLLPRGRVPPAGWGAAIPLLLGNAVLVLTLYAWLAAWLPGLAQGHPLLELLLDLHRHPVAVSGVVVVLAPVGEEILFRSVMLTGLLRVMSPGRAVVVSTLLFCLAHANLMQLPVGLVLGATLGWIFVRTRSLPLCIAVHLFHNALAVFGWAWNPLEPWLTLPPPTGVPVAPAAGMLVAALAASLLGALAFHHATRRTAPSWTRADAAPPLLVGTPPLLVRE